MRLNEIMMSLEIGLIFGIVAMGIYMTFRVIQFPDLTCDGSFVLGAAVSSVLIKFGCDPYISLLASLGAGALAGAITGILHIQFKITDLLSGILTGFMLYSINLRIMGGIPNITFINSTTIFSENPMVTLIIIAGSLWIGLAYVLRTDFGLALQSVGHNKQLSRNSGVNVSKMMLLALALSNALIALAGGVFSHHQGFADVGSGVGTVIVGLLSVMIGERILPYHSMSIKILSCLIGSVLYRLLIGLGLHSEVLGLTTSDLNVLTGIMVIITMCIPRRDPC
ncbi:ABC transporter permease [Holospora curviuscula]|uniref:Ribose ABC transporter permease protein n=1 Tax=Holospora curviuscula TaxID=1082868 RepID=A0A2S5RDH2_9PROT|nr:hypothetical protein [Holospora curviuscula]PPE05366.1 ribose ABC transporter permease protein [Holospora curviuscula]